MSRTSHAVNALSRPLAVAALAGLLLAAQSPAQAASVATWDKVAQCESTGVWNTNTNNNYYGGLQISLHNWQYYGGTAYAARPDLATKKQQILIAEKILADQGAGAWSCAPGTGLATDHADPYPVGTLTRAGVYHPQTQVFYLGNNAGGTVTSAKFGNPGWKPLVGNWDGAETATVGSYDASTGTFYLSNDNASAAASVKFGNPNWVPLAGDWNGDGKDSIGAYDPSASKFYLSNDNSSVATGFTYGSPNDLPVAGDWNGDGKDEVGVRHSQTFYLGDISGGTYGVTTFGNAGWLPVTGDWDENGTSTVGAYDPAASKFYLSNDNLNAANSFVYGSPGDVPVTGAW